jgi:hypothetical protein
MLNAVSNQQDNDCLTRDCCAGGDDTTAQLEEALLTQLLGQGADGAAPNGDGSPCGDASDGCASGSPFGAGGCQDPASAGGAPGAEAAGGSDMTQQEQALLAQLQGSADAGGMAGAAPNGDGSYGSAAADGDGSGGPVDAGDSQDVAPSAAGAEGAGGGSNGTITQLEEALLTQLLNQGSPGGAAEGGSCSPCDSQDPGDSQGPAPAAVGAPPAPGMAAAPTVTPALSGNLEQDMNTLDTMVSANGTDGNALSQFAQGVANEAGSAGDFGGAVCASDIAKSLMNGTYSQQASETELQAGA